jgi:hypothetical protein
VRRAASGLILGVLLLGGCAFWRGEPTALRFPEPPAIGFYDADGAVCMTGSDADRLARWLDELNAFRRARERLSGPRQ